MRINTVFMGTPDFAAKILEELITQNFEVVGVFTQPDKPRGRHMKLTACETKELAVSNSIPVYQPQKLKDSLVQLKELNPDVIVVAAYGKLLPKSVLDLPKYGCVNVHASLLPNLRGAAPIQWAIANGHKKTGVTTMLMNEGLDEGDILEQVETEIAKTDTGETLYNRLSSIGAKLLPQTLHKLANAQITPISQDANKATFAPIIKKSDGIIDTQKTAEEIDCLIRGFTPWPGVFLKDLKIHKAEVLCETTPLPSGTVFDKTKLACGNNTVLRLLELQAPGGKRMSADDFVRGHKIECQN